MDSPNEPTSHGIAPDTCKQYFVLNSRNKQLHFLKLILWPCHWVTGWLLMINMFVLQQQVPWAYLKTFQNYFFPGFKCKINIATNFSTCPYSIAVGAGAKFSGDQPFIHKNLTSPNFWQFCCLRGISWTILSRVDSRFAPSQWETALLCNDVSHWLGANLEEVFYLLGPFIFVLRQTLVERL